MADVDDATRWSRTPREYAAGIGGTFAVSIALAGLVYGITFAVSRGLANFGFLGSALPGLSDVGVYLAAVGLGCAAVAGVVMRPRRVPVSGGAGSDRTAGRPRVRVWGDLDAAGGVDGGLPDGEAVSTDA